MALQQLVYTVYTLSNRKSTHKKENSLKGEVRVGAHAWERSRVQGDQGFMYRGT